jgi:4-aminobutyrate aminotransferase-like enzyme
VTKAPAPHETARLIELLRDEGVLAGSEGIHGNIVKLRPPLIATAQDIAFALEAFDRSLFRLGDRNA